MSLSRWLLVLLSFAAAVGAAAYVARAGMPADGVSLALPAWAHAAALAAMLLEIGMRALKVQLSGAAFGTPFSFGTALRMSLGGDFGAAITPSRSGAEPARFLVLAEAGLAPAAVLLVLFAELLLETFSLAVVAAVLLLLFGGAGGVAASIAGLIGGYATFVIGAGAIGVVLSRRYGNGPPPAWAKAVRLHAGRWRAVQRALRQLRTGVAGLRHARVGLMWGSFTASVLHIVARLAILPVIVLALGGTDVPIDRLILWPLVLLYGGAAAPAPAGGGLIELAFKASLGGTIPAAIFGASLVWWRLYTFYGYIVLGALAAGATVLRAVRGRSTDHPSPTEQAARAAVRSDA